VALDELSSPESLSSLEPEWEDLWQRDANATPFQSPHWLLPWWDHFGTGELCVLAARDGGCLGALLPLFIVRDEDESLGLLIGTGNTDYLDALGSSDGWSAWLQQAPAQMWDLQQLRTSSPLLRISAPRGWTETVEDQDACPVLSIENAGDELQNLISTHARKKLRHSARSLARRGNVAYEEPDVHSLDAFMDALFDLHAARWKARGMPGVLADDVVQSFHRNVAGRMFRAGSLRMYAIRVDERFVAVFYGFSHQHIVYYYLSGFDPALEKLGIGNLIVAHAVQRAARDGARAFDFLRGAEEYKHAWGAQDRMNRRRQLIRL